MTTVPDIPVVQLPAIDVDGIAGDSAPAAPGSIWAVDVPRARRVTPVWLAALGVLAGVTAMALGTAAVIYAGSESTTPATVAPSSTQPPAATASTPTVERRVLALLAKPSTERIAFRGAPGLVLAVGSGGRAAILIRGLAPRPTDAPYRAWIVAPRGAPTRVASFSGAERAVFLSRSLGPLASVVVSPTRPIAGPPGRNRVVALR